MLEGLDESKLAAIRASAKTGCIAGLSEVIGAWNRRILDRLPLKTPLEQVMERYSYHMDSLAHLPEQDRVDVLGAYARAGRLRENRTTAVQRNYVGFIKSARDDLEEFPSARHFMDSVTLSGGPARDFSPEATLYVVSHTDLGLSLPAYFSDLTYRMRDYMKDPDNQALMVDQGGVIHLDPFIRIHAMFLEAPREIVEEGQSLIEEVTDQEEETPFRFEDEEDGLEAEYQEGFQRNHRTTKGYRD